MTISETHGVASASTAPRAPSAGFSVRFSRSVVLFARDTSGTSAIEYTLIAGVIVTGIVAALHNYADRLRELYESIGQVFARNT